MKVLRSIKSRDSKARKYLIGTDDNHVIETGYYDLDEHIICISTQIGCPMRCIFCATTIAKGPGKSNFIRNLTISEIISQCEIVLGGIKPDYLGTKQKLFSFAGMGEPFLNYKNMIGSIKTLGDLFPNARATIVTTGTKPQLISTLSRETFSIPVKLHLSLHAPNRPLRERLMPKTHYIDKSLEALLKYSLKTNTVPKINYILIKDINDSDQHAQELSELLSKYPFTIKLSNLNTINGLAPSNNKRVDRFEKILHSNNINTCRFISTGTDIEAGCGQFRNRYLSR